MKRVYHHIGTGLKTTLVLIVFSFLITNCSDRSMPAESFFLGQPPPGNTPQIFPLSVNQGFFAAERIAISNDGREIYYSEIKGYYPNTGESIKKYSYSDGEWKGPFTLLEGYAAPALSVTGDTMFVEYDFGTYFSAKIGSGWTKPKRILAGFDSAHYYQVTRNGNSYISSKSGNGAGLSDWCKVVLKEADTFALSLGEPLNTAREELDFFVSNDESFIIVTNRPRFGISYRKDDGTWTNPRNFSPKIDFRLGCWGPWVTPDNKYLFYSTGTKPDYSDVYTYWVRIDEVIDSLKHANLSPYSTSSIETQTAVVGQFFRFTVPENIFVDEDSDDTLTYSAQMMNGDPIPAWIAFDPATKTFSGTPAEVGDVTVYVIVTDSENAIGYSPVKIIISTSPAK